MMMSGWMMMAGMILTIPVMIMTNSLHSPLCHDFVTTNAFHCWKSRYQTFADCSVTMTCFLFQNVAMFPSLDCWQRLILFILILHKTGYLRSIFILRLMLSPPSD